MKNKIKMCNMWPIKYLLCYGNKQIKIMTSKAYDTLKYLMYG
jgi:hypothetical protein